MATVATTPRSTTITLASATAGPFDIGFRIFAEDGVRVYLNGVLNEDYTVTTTLADGYDDSATITFDASLAIDDVVVIDGLLAPGRSDDYLASDGQLTRKLNIELGRQSSIDSEARRDIDRSIRGLSAMEPLVPEVGKVISFNTNFDPVMVDPETGPVASSPYVFVEDYFTNITPGTTDATAAMTSALTDGAAFGKVVAFKTDINLRSLTTPPAGFKGIIGLNNAKIYVKEEHFDRELTVLADRNQSDSLVFELVGLDGFILRGLRFQGDYTDSSTKVLDCIKIKSCGNYLVQDCHGMNLPTTMLVNMDSSFGTWEFDNLSLTDCWSSVDFYTVGNAAEIQKVIQNSVLQIDEGRAQTDVFNVTITENKQIARLDGGDWVLDGGIKEGQLIDIRTVDIPGGINANEGVYTVEFVSKSTLNVVGTPLTNGATTPMQHILDSTPGVISNLKGVKTGNKSGGTGGRQSDVLAIAGTGGQHRINDIYGEDVDEIVDIQTPFNVITNVSGSDFTGAGIKNLYYADYNTYNNVVFRGIKRWGAYFGAGTTGCVVNGFVAHGARNSGDLMAGTKGLIVFEECTSIVIRDAALYGNQIGHCVVCTGSPGADNLVIVTDYSEGATQFANLNYPAAKVLFALPDLVIATPADQTIETGTEYINWQTLGLSRHGNFTAGSGATDGYYTAPADGYYRFNVKARFTANADVTMQIYNLTATSILDQVNVATAQTLLELDSFVYIAEGHVVYVRLVNAGSSVSMAGALSSARIEGPI